MSHAPPAAMRFEAMATNVVARRPIAEMRTNPVASAPTAAPIVFSAYRVGKSLEEEELK
jgi:hypothetical protein